MFCNLETMTQINEATFEGYFWWRVGQIKFDILLLEALLMSRLVSMAYQNKFKTYFLKVNNFFRSKHNDCTKVLQGSTVSLIL